MLLALALVSSPVWAQTSETSETPAAPSRWTCKPLAFVVSGVWVPFSSQIGENSMVTLAQQPFVTNHPIVVVFGMDKRARDTNDTTATAHTFEYKRNSAFDVRVGEGRRGRFMSAANPADAGMLAALPTDYEPMRFDLPVFWHMDTKYFSYTFQHAMCGEQRIIYKYNPKGSLKPIVPSTNTGGGDSAPTAPSGSAQHCQLTAVTAANQWSCTPAFARGVYDYQCTAPSSAFLERITVQAATGFLAMGLTADADAVADSVTRSLESGVDSASFPLQVGRNVIVINTEWTSVCNVSYVFEVQREAPATGGSSTSAASWRVEDWGACSGDCNTGVSGSQSRQVVCVTEAGQSVDESRCAGTKPAASRTCDATCANDPDSNSGKDSVIIDGGNGKDTSSRSAAPASAAASPLALLAAVAFALLALNQ